MRTKTLPAKSGKTCAAMPPKPPSVDLSYIMNLNSKLNYTGWYNAVKNRGIWDFKQIRNLDDFGVPLKQSQYKDFGNWNFGLTAAQQGIPRQIALRGAGWAGQRAIGKSFLSALGTALGNRWLDIQTQISLAKPYDNNHGSHEHYLYRRDFQRYFWL